MKPVKTTGYLAFMFICLVGPSLAEAQPSPQLQSWQTSWDAFVDEFQAHLARAEHVSVFEQKVVGKVVTWEGRFGKVSKPSFTFGGPSEQWFADVEFTPRKVRGDGIELRVVPPPLAVRHDELPRWQALAAGSRVRVRMTFRTNNMLHTLFVMDKRKVGEEVVMFMAQDGELVKVLDTAAEDPAKR